MLPASSFALNLSNKQYRRGDDSQPFRLNVLTVFFAVSLSRVFRATLIVTWANVRRMTNSAFTTRVSEHIPYIDRPCAVVGDVAVGRVPPNTTQSPPLPRQSFVHFPANQNLLLYDVRSLRACSRISYFSVSSVGLFIFQQTKQN